MGTKKSSLRGSAKVHAQKNSSPGPSKAKPLPSMADLHRLMMPPTFAGSSSGHRVKRVNPRPVPVDFGAQA